MAGERTLPGLGLKAFWTLGSNGWKPDMDANFRILSALVQAVVISGTTPLPTGSNGDMYIVTTGANVNDIAIKDNGAWVYLTPRKGTRVYLADLGAYTHWDGVEWVLEESGGGGGTPHPISIGVWVAGKPAAGEKVARVAVPKAADFPNDLTGSIAVAQVASTGNVSFAVSVNGSAEGTIVFNASDTGVFTGFGAINLVAGDIVQITAPSTQDATLADISITLLGELA